MTARVLLGADVSYPDVYAAASYVDVQLTAEVTMPDIISVEVVELSDLATILFEKAQADTIASSDQITTVGFEKAQADTIASSDQITTVGFAKLIGELLSVSDENIVDFQGNKSDNVATSDGGSLLAQSYCDITYFAEDYVGESRTF